MPFVRSCGGNEPSQNFQLDTIEDDNSLKTTPSIVTELYFNESNSRQEDDTACGGFSGFEPKQFFMDHIVPNLGAIEGINDIERDAEGTHLYLWQRSTFYDKTRIDMNAWLLKYFTFADGKISSVPVRTASGEISQDSIAFPHYKSFDVDETRLVMKITTQKREYVLLAPTSAHLDAAISGFEESLDPNAVVSEESTVLSEEDSSFRLEVHESLISFPKGMSATNSFLFFVTFPLKALVHFTIPDVRNGSSISITANASLASIACIVALIIGSYVMVTSLEDIGAILSIPPAVLGVTVSAAGTSLPNLISSTCAARLGHGNMAIANIFGSNTFNLLVGLGVPWMLYTTIYDDYYSDLPAGRINESMCVMVLSLVLFLAMVYQSGFVLVKWHAWLFSILYVVFIVHSIAQCFI